MFLSEFDLNAYDYHLPEELIAQSPASPRDHSRLFVLHRATSSKKGRWEHRLFKDLPEYLDSNDMAVVNNTRVLKARLLGNRIRTEAGREILGGAGREILGGKVEFVLLEELKPRVWEGLFHASAGYVPGFRFRIPTPDGKGLQGVLVRGAQDSPSGTVVAEFDRDPIESGAGEIPLPPYITEKAALPELDSENYQTVYAKKLGSAAAPTAGLHFTERVMESLKSRGVHWQEVTLHVGVGTFRPVKENDIRKHVMHEERYEISEESAQAITQWKAAGRRVLAVGTTSTRTLESAWCSGTSHLNAGTGRTSLFIKPGNSKENTEGFKFQVVDRLLTNFHLPKSTLLILVSAFAGRELALAAYEEAVRQRYRFFSYGDAMLIL